MKQVNGKVRKIGSRILQILLCLILVFNIVLIYMEKTKGAEALEDIPYALLTVEGGSMEPHLHEGDGVFIWQTPYEELKKGDIIVFFQAGELITHEIIEIQDGVITAKGTANDQADEPVTKEQYRAKVLFKVPGMINIQAVYENPVTLVIMIVLLALILFGKDIFNHIYDRFS